MEQLPFDEQFQRHFINHLLQDSEFSLRVIDDLSPELFTGDVAQRAVRLIQGFVAREKAAPGTLIFRVVDSFKDKGLLTDETLEPLSLYLDELFGSPLQNRSFLLREFGKFVRHQMFKRAIIPAAEYVKKGDFEKAEALLKEAFLFQPAQDQDLGRPLLADPDARIRRRQEEDVARFWMLIPEIDAQVLGLKKGELGVWQSQRSSAGKSAALVFLARSAVFQGKRVLIYSLEMGEEEYEDRLDMCVAGITQADLSDRVKIHNQMMRFFSHGGSLWIKQFPGQLTTIADLRRHKKMLESVHNFHPDILILDYADELATEANYSTENSFTSGKIIYSTLRGWAVEDELVIWTGMQSNRGGMAATVADQEHSGESIAKAWIADLILSINRTPEEARNNITRLYVVKNRRGTARYSINISTDFSRMQFYTRPENE